jgi:hypothetical protein
MHNRPLTRGTAVAATALVLSACGIVSSGDDFLDQSPRSMAKTAFADMRDVSSMRILGSYEDDELGLTRVDVSLDKTSCTATLRTEAGVLRIVTNPEGAWVQGDEHFWRAKASSPGQADLLGSYASSWVAVRKKQGFRQLCDLDTFVKNFKVDKDDTDDTIDVGDVEEVGDLDAVALNGRDGKERVTAWVAVEAPHYVVKLAPTDDKGMRDEFFFSSFGLRVDAESPDEKDVLTVPGL